MTGFADAMNDNEMTGNVMEPSFWYNMDLSEVYLGRNRFEGTISRDIGTLTNLTIRKNLITVQIKRTRS